MTNWKNIHPDFTPELQKEWEERGFRYEEAQSLITNGLTPWDCCFADFLRKTGRKHGLTETKTNELRKEYKNKLQNYIFTLKMLVEELDDCGDKLKKQVLRVTRYYS